MSLLSWFLPSWVHTFLTGTTFTLVAVAIFLYATGASKAVAGVFDTVTEFLKPIASQLGSLFAWFLQACVDGVGLMFANPKVFAPMSVIILGLGVRYLAPQIVATKLAQHELSQCLSAQKKTVKSKTTKQTSAPKGWSIW